MSLFSSQGVSSTSGDLLTACLKYAATSILSVGSGDGSQQLAIVREGHTNICATFYDSKQEVIRKYPHSVDILDELTSRCKHEPKFEVDATRLHDYKDVLGGAKFDIIFFTFPHTGVPNNNKNNANSNKALLRGFLLSAHHLLSPNGQVQLTLKDGEHYERWGFKSIITEVTGLKYDGSGRLRKNQFPGYRHRLTRGMDGNLKEVPDKQGATVHHFRASSSDSSSDNDDKDSLPQDPSPWVNHLTSLHIFAMDSVEYNLKNPEAPSEVSRNDEWVCEKVQEFFKTTNPTKHPTVLDIRRAAFVKPLPEVPQLNRVLYGLHQQNWLLQVKPGGGPNKKPRWKRGRDDASES